ncbi:hypothetical protein B4U79_19020 [Dinothrombium tinctorium]|uniref:Uncharacterized protein n=1 Tax=Dinothrombium tinctorium TaxID=1965070 RepID=A0A3S3PZ13_9ACAR|nr:hypothetical protein B4U79_19183 [Dinothrombium tinctorium]RWS09317.1 hypothetical protein B4U79_19021 [Dinothrombium tinctorium]RWS09318.1 hypothetical protein B4U79_19020 [Dinothrombium tinctorium]
MRLVSQSVKINSEQILRKRKIEIYIGPNVDLSKLDVISRFYSNIKIISFNSKAPSFQRVLSLLKRNLNQIDYLKLYNGSSENHILPILDLLSDLKCFYLDFHVYHDLRISDYGLSRLLSGLSNLKTVSFVNMKTSQFSKSLQSLISLQHLTDLTLERVAISKNEFRLLMDAKAQSLERFSVNCKQIWYDPSFFFQEIFNKCTKLKLLHFDFMFGSMENVKFVNISTLSELSLSVYKCSANQTSERLMNVRKLTLCLYRSTDAELARIISLFPEIKCLDLKWPVNFESNHLTTRTIERLRWLKKIKFIGF